MASGIVTVIILVAVAAAAFYLYKHYKGKQQTQQLQTFASPKSTTGGTANFLSPITTKSILG